MEAATFLEQFGALAEAPGGVATLRELVLQLAVQGNLVAQREDEGSGEELGDAIEGRYVELVDGGEIRDSGVSRELDERIRPFSLPANWAWCKLGRVMRKMGAGSTPLGGNKVYVKDGVAFLRSQNVWDRGLDLSDVARISEQTHDEMRGTWVECGDVLLNITGASIGRSAVVPDTFEPANVSQHVAILRLVDKRLRHFLHLCVISPFFQQTIMRVQVGVSREGLSMTRLREFPLPLPPLAEQHRIVAKVDELLALCDELEARQERQRELRSRLSRSAWASVTTAPSPADFAPAWQLVADHFDLLYDVPGTVADLRQAVLQLAVMGRLVEQDDRDEPASTFVARLKLHNAAREKSRRGRSRFDEGTVDCRALEFTPPTNWETVPFGQLVFNRDGERIPLSKEIRAGRKGPYDYYGASGVIDHMDDYLFDAPLLLVGEDGANLINRSTPIAFIASGKYWVNNHAHVLDGITVDFLRYLELYVNAIDLKPYVTGTAQPKMNQAKMNSIPVAVPPEAEQRRIVAKVNQLMALCDALESQLAASQTAGEKLLGALVRGLVNGAG